MKPPLTCGQSPRAWMRNCRGLECREQLLNQQTNSPFIVPPVPVVVAFPGEFVSSPTIEVIVTVAHRDGGSAQLDAETENIPISIYILYIKGGGERKDLGNRKSTNNPCGF